MRWFKHMSGASRDAFIVELEAVFGLEGYARWWKLLEIIAEQSDPEKGRWTVTYPNSVWCSFLKCKPKVLLSFLEHSRNQGKTNWKQNGNVSEIEVCNMQTIRDNHTKDLQAPGKKLASKDIDIDPEKDIKTPLPPEGVSEGEPKSASGRFTPPTLSEVSDYLAAKGSTIDPEEFHAHYEASGWMRGKNRIRDWKACVRTWEVKRKPKAATQAVENTAWQQYRPWASGYLERRATMHPTDTPEATPEAIDAGARQVAEWIAPDAYTEKLLADTVAWLLNSPERCKRVPSLANLSDSMPPWGFVVTWASNGARGVSVMDVTPEAANG